MAGVVAVKIKIMPESIDTNLNSIREQAQKKLEEIGAKGTTFEEQPVAFGLKVLVVTFALSEDKSTDIAEDVLKEVPGVSSVDIIDYRRAFG